jgi:hypothetical protein
MKQTVVEWLVDEMNSIKGSSTNMNGKIQFLEKELNKLYEQANKMFEEQIKDAYNDGVNDECIGGSKTPEQYYNETFKSE